MRVLVDLTSLADNFSGIERFALCITKELLSGSPKDDMTYILLFKNKIHQEFLGNQSNVQISVLNGSNKLLFNQFVLPSALLKIKADYYFFPAFPAPFFFFKKNAISTIHDVGCWDCPSNNKKYMTAYFKLMYWKAAFGTKRVVTVSEFSKERISAVLKKIKSDITVVYDGLSDCFKNFKYDERMEKKAIKTYGLPLRYLLCLSTLEPRKNLRLLIEAYNQLLEEEKIDIDLVLAGRKGWYVDNLLSGLNESTVARIHFTGFIDDDLLPYVYRRAKLFVFPSIYEGFGVPPIEAMSMGIPVVSSDAASLPETLGDAAILFSNNDCEDLKKKILYVLRMNQQELLTRRDKGIEQAHKYDWKREALKLKDSVFV